MEGTQKETIGLEEQQILTKTRKPKIGTSAGSAKKRIGNVKDDESEMTKT